MNNYKKMLKIKHYKNPSVNFHNWAKSNIVYTSVCKTHDNIEVDIVIPVYNGYEYLDKLFKTVKNTKVAFRLIVVEDMSTDKRVRPYLEELFSNGVIDELLLNDANIGFVKSVNKALAISKNHVALLNTDIELPDSWLERLIIPIVEDDRIATTTPYTNSGTICSFPNIAEDNVLFDDLNYKIIDNAFKRVKPQFAEMPTGVGFCMGMNKNVIQEVGLLDELNFEHGYGEENDWCQRAIIKGYRNVQVENLFVYHKHGGSFLTEQKQKLIAKNSKIINEKYPNYNQDVANFFYQDINKTIRQYVTMCLACLNKVVLFLDHNLGGGATTVLEREKQKLLSSNCAVIVLRYRDLEQDFTMTFEYKNYCFSYIFKNFYEIESLFKELKISEVVFNEFVTYSNLYECFENLMEWKTKYNTKFKFFVHDFYCICPAINLLNYKGIFCNVPDITLCESCMRKHKNIFYKNYLSIYEWRNNWERLLKECEEIYCFSKNSKNLFKAAYVEVENVDVYNNEPSLLPKIEKKHKLENHLKIGLLGGLAELKGNSVISDMISYIEQKNLGIEIILIGHSFPKISSDFFTEIGAYSVSELPNLMIQNDIDLVLISSICPETFSFTISEVMAMGYPLTSFKLGAQAERIKEYEKGFLISEINPIMAIDEIYKYYNDNIVDTYQENTNKSFLFIIKTHEANSNYRAKAFAENLMYNGVNVEIKTITELLGTSGEIYQKVIIYNCDYSKELINFLDTNEIQEVWYDIEPENLFQTQYRVDELLIRALSKVRKCLELADRIITSTDIMKKHIIKNLSNKEVSVIQNMVNAEMIYLSETVLNNRKSNTDIITMGYLCDEYDDEDNFSTISNVVLNILKDNSYTRLKLIGNIELSSDFNSVINQVEKVESPDWRLLPALMSSVDINLAPINNNVFYERVVVYKWVQAALVQAMTIASYYEESALLINKNNVIFCNKAEDWEKEIKRFISNSKERSKIASVAHKFVKNEYISTSCSAVF